MKTEDFICKINAGLDGKFEKELLIASLANLEDKTNKLRFNNFSYSIRELTRHVLKRLAPDENVIACSWFSYDDPEKEQITRAQRIKYAVQAGLSDKYIIEVLKIDIKSISKKIIEAIGKLSKYTHVNEDTFDLSEDEVDRLADNVMDAVILLFTTIDQCCNLIIDNLEEVVDKSIIDNLFFDTISSIDWLATHYEIENYNTEEVEVLGMNESQIYFRATGTVQVRLQYGSDGDLKRGDGMELNESFPFSGEFSGNLDDMSKFDLDTDSFEVDTESHWGDEDEDI